MGRTILVGTISTPSLLGHSLKCFEGNVTGAGEARVFKTKEVECEEGVTKCYKIQEGKI